MFKNVVNTLGYLLFLHSFSFVACVRQYGTNENTLYVAEDSLNLNKLTIINKGDLNENSSPYYRKKRETTLLSSDQRNISTWITHLNDSHQQLMVHWVGEGSNVIICLARDTSPRTKGSVAPSALYISYDYGKNFTNKTEFFKLTDELDSDYAQLDKFFNHPKYPEFCVFVDSTNKKIWYTKDNGQYIHRSDLNFHPSDLAFDDDIPDKFIILDRVDSNRKLYLTVDGGKSFKHIQSFVKTFFWSSGTGFPKMFYVERWKPDRTSTILSVNDPVNLMHNGRVLFEDAKDFQIKGDFMFATKQSKERNTIDLYISHQRGPFYKAEFQTELDRKKFHIADVTDMRIFVSVMHTESLANLYVSEIYRNFTQYDFVISLEQILSYFPDGNWKYSWLEDVTEDPFTDMYRVEGLRGIYIASRVDSKTPSNHIGPEHLTSLITFDHGNTWSPINPPTEDENGNAFNCQIEHSCSLHLCQKFSQLYPVTRSASIMSSKAAPGIIMATGVMGKSLKGIPGVYLSRDAGLTWKRILKDYYFFNYGDHGGVIVAVKYFKNRGETRKILYSTNEGIDWQSYQFNADDLRIYGLMTEPGENTTTFTMFGSSNDRHQWIIITIDLKNAFERNCTQEDYKFWSPSPPNSTVSCVLGMKETFQRRYPYANCYNGIDYDRPVKKETCRCNRKDYECEYSFYLSGKECVRNKTMKFDAYKTPPECVPGRVYKRTKGYKRIDGDVCHSASYVPYEPEWVPCPLEEVTEFMLVALKDKIARIDLADNTTIFPVKNQRHIVALEFDMKNNCIYWGDIEVDKIMRQCFTNGSAAEEIIVENELSSIEGMSLDWISNVLFFVDGTKKKIEAVRTDLTNAGRMRTTILDSKVLSKPRGIVVHPKAGYLFWTDWDKTRPSISRSNLDGTDIKKLFEKPIVEWPNGITIDHTAERIYWVDAMEDYIASSDLNGHYFRRILWNDEKVSHPFAVAVLKDKMYWDDWKAKSIFIADKNSGANVITINDSFSGLMDLKVFAHFIQHGTNMCHDREYHKCDTMCLGKPGGFSCLCPDGFVRKDNKCVCHNGMEPMANMTCPQKAGYCDSNEFACKNGLCISSVWRCNGNDDCGDQSDEVGCAVCSPPMVACDWDHRCYLPQWRCDGDFDCADMTDEKDCEPRNCSANQFRCSNGHCIDKKWQCDGDNDCKDNSDEENCHAPSRRPETFSCSVNGFTCGNSTKTFCIPNSWVCDGESDCPGGEDEIADRCKNSTCSPYMFRCPNGKCIFKSWVCDGENDCGDDEKSDEKNCDSIDKSKIIPRPSTDKPAIFLANTTCLDWMFKCDNGNCLPYWWRCDGINDCGDRSDEIGCGFIVAEPISSTPSSGDSKRTRCSRNEFTCSPGVCIPLSWVCDMADDCPGGEDERGCARHDGAAPVCGAEETPCADGRGCVHDTAICDGTPDCFDRSDETHCPSYIYKTPVTECPPDFVLCNNGLMCINSNAVCNGEKDCDDNSDETNCSNALNKFVDLFLGIDINQRSINASSFLVSCWVFQPKTVEYSFLPSIAKVNDGVWHNMTWSNNCAYRFTNLEPYTRYNVTFYVRDVKLNTTFLLTKYVDTTTAEDVPSPPTRLTVRQMVGRRLNVEWDPPKQPNGVVKSYILYHEPPTPPVSRIFKNTNVTVEGYFVPKKKYTFWVRAVNGAAMSNMSEPAVIVFDNSGDVDDLISLSNVTMDRVNDSTAILKWHELSGVDGYVVIVRPPDEYAHLPAITTKDTNVTLTDLPIGVESQVYIVAYKDETYGVPFTMPIYARGEKDELLNVTVSLLEDKPTAVQLSWNRPTSDRYKNRSLVYEVRYNKTEFGYDAVFSSKPIVTSNTSLVIDNLNACESYFFTAGLRGGPLAVSREMEVITKENSKAPVKNLHFEMNDQNSTLKIMWHASCDALKEPVKYRVSVCPGSFPVNYQLTITEMTKNITSRYILKASKNSSLEHIIVNVPQGGRYNICVYMDAADAAVVCDAVRSAPIPPPQNVVAWLDDSGHVMVSWHMTHAPEHDDFKYEILISKNEFSVDLLHPDDDVKVVQAEQPPVLALAEPAPQLFVAVRSRSPEGYCSDLSEVHTLSMQGVAAEVRTAAGAMWWGLGAAGVAALALAAALLHLALRHRRLTRSFLRFTAATPRYDSRRGQATLGDHDDDDVPPIHGFSDDEPLVIA